MHKAKVIKVFSRKSMEVFRDVTYLVSGDSKFLTIWDKDYNKLKAVYRKWDHFEVNYED